MRTPPASPAPTPETVEDIAREFVRHHLTNGGCSWCGGLPHHVSCQVGRMAAALAAPPSGAQERIKELAEIGARLNHEWYFDAAANIDDEPQNGHSNAGAVRPFDVFGFRTCPHLDCALFAPAPPETQQ